MSKCKRCDYLYAIIQMVRETNSANKVDLRSEKDRKAPSLFLNEKVNHFLFRADYIEDFCLDADKEVPKPLPPLLKKKAKRK